MQQIAKQIIDFLTFSEKLKTQKRDCLLSNGKLESVGDHSWHLALMAIIVHPHLKTKVDLLKALKMIAIHDLTEVTMGDIPYSHAYENKNLKEQKDKQELEEIEKIKNKLGGEDGQRIYDLWHEYERRECPESKFVKALDSIEPNLQGLLTGDISYWDEIYYPLCYSKADKHCMHEEILSALNEEIKDRTDPEMIKIGLDPEEMRKKAKEM